MYSAASSGFQATPATLFCIISVLASLWLSEMLLLISSSDNSAANRRRRQLISTPLTVYWTDHWFSGKPCSKLGEISKMQWKYTFRWVFPLHHGIRVSDASSHPGSWYCQQIVVVLAQNGVPREAKGHCESAHLALMGIITVHMPQEIQWTAMPSCLIICAFFRETTSYFSS